MCYQVRRSSKAERLKAASSVLEAIGMVHLKVTRKRADAVGKNLKGGKLVRRINVGVIHLKASNLS